MLTHLNRVLRSFSHNKFFATVNLAVLVTGISSSILIILYVNHQSAFDSHHINSERIFRLSTDIKMGQSEGETPLTSIMLGPTLKEENDFVQGYVRFHPFNMGVFRIETKQKIFHETGVFATEPSVFNVFSYPMIEGDPETALKDPHAVVLTETSARKYFGSIDCIGNELIIDYESYHVTAVLKDLPTNSDLKFNALLVGKFDDEDWDKILYHTYVLVKDKKDQASLNVALEKIEAEFIKPYYRKAGMPIGLNLFATPLRQVHFHQGLIGDTPKANYNYVYFFLIIGFFILCIASFNYINLSAIQSFKRSKEIGIKKIQGARRWQLVAQFIAESSVLTVISLAISLIVIAIALPHFNNLAKVEILFRDLFNPGTLAMIGSVVFMLGLISGVIPALYLTSFRVIQIFSGKLPTFNRGFLFKGLLVAQFSMSVIMVICTLAVYRQMDFMKNKDLGLSMNKIIAIDLPVEMNFSQNVRLKNEFSKYNSLYTASLVGEGSVPGSDNGIQKEDLTPEGGRNGRTTEFFNLIHIDQNYFDLLKIELALGRAFDPSRENDGKYSLVVNESFVQYMEWDDPIGKKIDFHGRECQVIGVVKDYHYKSLHSKIEPLVFAYNFGGANNQMLLSITEPNDLDVIKKIWKKQTEDLPFYFSFIDLMFNQQYRQEEATMTLFFLFSALVILLTCIGLFGLSSMITKQRVKEIGIRKILGGDMTSIIYVLLRNTMILLVISVFIAAPIANYGIKIWMRDFTYQTQIGMFTYIFAWLIVFVTAILTAFYHTVRVVNANPVIALRNE
jgi:putative ABC transport system permease protein